MFLLALHIVSIGIVIMVVWSLAYGRGHRAGERQARRRLELEAQRSGGDVPVAASAGESS